MKHIQKDFEVEFKSLHEDDEDDGMFRFEGLASTFGNEDRDGDIIVRGAFAESLKGAHQPMLLWQHRIDQPIGTLELEERPDGLFVRGTMPRADTLVSGRIIPQMKAGTIKTMSIGFSIIEEEIRGAVRFIQKLFLWEVSLVTIPANPQAVITGMTKGATTFQDLPLNTERSWDSTAAVRRWREFTGTTEEDIPRQYRNGFFWFDENAADTLGAYKLPFVDVIDGRATAIFRGVVAAAGAMLGARGGVNIPDEDRPAVIRHIERYYSKAERPSPFREENGVVDIEILETLSHRDIEKMLRAGVGFSQSAAKSVLSGREDLVDKNQPRDASLSSVAKDILALKETIKGGHNG